MRKAEIKMHDLTAGWLTEDENGYHFVYDAAYLQKDKVPPVSLTLPLNMDPSKVPNDAIEYIVIARISEYCG